MTGPSTFHEHDWDEDGNCSCDENLAEYSEGLEDRIRDLEAELVVEREALQRATDHVNILIVKSVTGLGKLAYERLQRAEKAEAALYDEHERLTNVRAEVERLKKAIYDHSCYCCVCGPESTHFAIDILPEGGGRENDDEREYLG